MSDAQRIIKYLAIAFAWFLVFSIISGIMSAILSLGNIFGNKEEGTDVFEGIDINGNVSILDVDVNNVDVIIEEGYYLKAETNNENVRIKQVNNKLFITQKKQDWYKNDERKEIVISIPYEFMFDAVSLEAGAGNVNIDGLSAKKLELGLGAGNVKINKLVVSNETEIEGGAGEIIITDSKLNNMDLDLGVGKVSITSSVTGNSQIDSGIGEVNLNLIGSEEDYKILVEKGIGTTTISGKTISNNVFYGNGSNNINIEGGVGGIKINFVNN